MEDYDERLMWLYGPGSFRVLWESHTINYWLKVLDTITAWKPYALPANKPSPFFARDICAFALHLQQSQCPKSLCTTSTLQRSRRSQCRALCQCQCHHPHRRCAQLLKLGPRNDCHDFVVVENKFPADVSFCPRLPKRG